MPSAFLVERQRVIVELDANARDNTDAVIDRAFELLDRPEERDPDVVRLRLDYVAERYEEETNSSRGALELREVLTAYFAMPWAKMQEIPGRKRGVNYQAARQLVLSTAYEQAVCEIIAQGALACGEEMGTNNAAAAERMSASQIKQMAATGGVDKTPGQLAAQEGTADAG